MAYNGKRLEDRTSHVYDAYANMNQNRRRHHKNKKRYGFNATMAIIVSCLVMVIAVGSVAYAYQDYKESRASIVETLAEHPLPSSVHTVSLAMRSEMFNPSLFIDQNPISETLADTAQDNNALAEAESTDKVEGVTTTRLGVIVDSYDANTDYTSLINDAYEQITDANEDHILGLCEIYEEQRNLKVEDLYPDTYEITHTFVASNSAEDIENILNPHQPYMEYTEEEAIMLACVVYAEAGSSWITDQHQRDVASVVINRVESPLFKQNTIYDVIHAPGQYPGTCNNTKYDERSYANAIYVLENGPISDGIFQANFKQGTQVINTYRYGDNVTYICK